MQHEEDTIDAIRPKSPSPTHVREAYSTWARIALGALWEMVASEPRYTSNEGGHLAWDVAPAVRAACELWRVDGDREHLDLAVLLSRRICEATDVSRGVLDWRGVSGAAWSSGARYTAGTARIGSVAGRPLEMRAAADSIRVLKPTATTVTVSTAIDGQTVWTSPEASVRPSDENYLPDLLASRSGVNSALLHGLDRPRSLSALQEGTYELSRQLAPHLLHTAMIVRALLDVAECLTLTRDRDDRLTANEFRDVASAAMATHDDDIFYVGQGALYATPVDFPGRRLGVSLPHNHMADAATSQFLLSRIKGQEDRRPIGIALMRPFIAEVNRYIAGKLEHPWHYYPENSGAFSGLERTVPMAERIVAPVPREEDSSHATIRVRSLAEWRRIAPGICTERAISAVAATCRQNFLTRQGHTPTMRWLPSSDRAAERNGVADTYSGAWGMLTRWDPALKRRLNRLAAYHPPHQLFGATLQSSVHFIAMNTPARDWSLR